MGAPGPDRSRRYDVPPLWSVPLLLIAAIMLIVTLLPMGFGPVGLVVALFLVAWLQRRAEAYVRARDSQEP